MHRDVPRRGGGSNFRRRPGGNDPQPQASIDLAAIRFGERIDPKLYSDIAEAAARSVAGDCGGSRNKPTQLRRFYDELVMLQEKVGADPARFEQQAPFIQMLKAKVAYAVGRKKVDTNFEQLLRRVIEQATDHGRLAQAKLFMEAFMAFYKVHGPRD